MHRSQGVDRDRVLAWCCVVFAHLLAWWLLTRPHASDTGTETDGLDVVWIEPALPAAAMPSRPERSPRPMPSGSTIVRDASRRKATSHPVTPTPEAEDSPSLSAVFLEQGRAWATEQHSPGDFARNPLSPRALSPADGRADRFRMREPITPADIVAGIGALFGGGPGDLVDCSRVRDNIADLATGGASERLEEELRRDRRLCRDAAMP